MHPEQHPPRLRERSRGLPAPTRHGRLKPRRARVGIFKLLGASLAVLLVSGAGVAAYAVVDTVSSIKPGIHLLSAPGQPARPIPNVGAVDGAVNLLLTGTDTRTGQGGKFNNAADQAASSGAGNNDVTMVLHISKDHKHATVISIPRDLMTAIPACPDGKGGSSYAQSSAMFNTTLSTGGLSCVVLTAEQLTGLSIPYAAEISFDGVIGMSNAVGGVPVCLATPLTDPYVGLNLPAGQQTLVGANALAFVRSRHGVGDGSDLGRISNQQLFLSALLRKVTSAGVLSNPVTLYTLAHAAVTNMVLSDTLTQPTTLVGIALALKNVSLSNIVFLQYPTGTDPTDPNRVVASSEAVTLLKGALANDQPIQLSGKLGVAAVPAPGTAPAPTPAPSSTPAAAAPSTATATPTPGPTSVALPSNVTGQTADQQTCTKGN
ncbi:LCP family protein [Diaminobutyricibacter sp. McL0618]|uniref:LCP family protein n=1 Tax=Leifsonia sp. McL0618 TaxID=3415677 RepID=UPI003CF65E90